MTLDEAREKAKNGRNKLDVERLFKAFEGYDGPEVLGVDRPHPRPKVNHHKTKLSRKELGELARDRSRRDEFIETVPYMKWYEDIDFRQNPEKYKIGRGEQGVLMAEPYKSEIVPHWRFKTVEIAEVSSKKIYEMFLEYLDQGDFVGADMARKFLQMGYTRARRYANHKSGRKYAPDGVTILPFEADSQTSEKAQSARIFKALYDIARVNEVYLGLKRKHQELSK